MRFLNRLLAAVLLVNITGCVGGGKPMPKPSTANRLYIPAQADSTDHDATAAD